MSELIQETASTETSVPAPELSTDRTPTVAQPITAFLNPLEPMTASVMASSETPKEPDKNGIMDFALTYSVDLASERFGVPRSTIRAWLKEEHIPCKPLFNTPGQGRKISYSRELDQQIADKIRELLSSGKRVTVQDVCQYARGLIQQENPDFTASSGWAQRFLVRNNIDLGSHSRKMIPSNRRSHSESSYSDARGRPLSYSADTDNKIADWVRSRTENGETVTNSELRKYAKELVMRENPSFTGSASWAQNFLLRHRLTLQPTTLLNHNEVEVAGSTRAALSHVSPASSQDTTSASNSTPVSRNQPKSQEAHSQPGTIEQTVVSYHSGVMQPSDDAVTSTLALLTGDSGDHLSGQLTQSQAAALASLTDLPSEMALADLLNSTQDSANVAAAFNQPELEAGAGQGLYLGLGSSASQLTELMSSTSTMAPSVEIQGQGGGENVLLQGLLPHPPSPTHANGTGKYNDSPGNSTRLLSYTRETDRALANWVKQQQADGRKVTFASLRSHAKKAVSVENPHFNASVGWVTPFLLRHNLDLKVNDKKRQNRKISTPRKLLTKGEEILGQEGGGAVSRTPEGEEGAMLEASALSVEPSAGHHIQESDSSLEVSSSSLSLPDTPRVERLGKGKEALLSLEDLKQAKLSTRTRHTLAEKLEVVRLMKQYNLAGHYVCRMLGIANSTIAGWIKLVEQRGPELEALSSNRKRSNRSGQGRPLTYSKEKDEAIARWVRQQQEIGVQVTAAKLSAYASHVIGEENQNFVASVGWRHKFLQRHNLQLNKGDKNILQDEDQSIPIPVQTEEVCTDDFNPEVLDKPYPDKIDQKLVELVKMKVAESGSLSIQLLCKIAEEQIVPVNPMFVATLGWAFKFLHRHNLFLDPKPIGVDVNRKRTLSGGLEAGTPKRVTGERAASLANRSLQGGVTVSPSTGNLCEALLSLSSQQQLQLLGQQQQQQQEENQTLAATSNASDAASGGNISSHSNTYFGKPARDLTTEEKEEVVRYANATTLQKAAIKYGVAAPTVWRWRMELKLHQPKYTAMQKKYIIKFSETNSLKEAAQRFGITTKTVQNWRRALQMDGTLADLEIAAIPPPMDGGDVDGMDPPASTSSATGGLIAEEVIPLDSSHFQYVVDGGEVAEANKDHAEISSPGLTTMPTGTMPLEMTHEVQVQDVGMEYDVVASEGHAAKPRCTSEEKLHILKYALDHSIKEASQKFGISPGTLYYWKKNFVTNQKKQEEMGSSHGTAIQGYSQGGLETTVVSVPMPTDIITSSTNLLQSAGESIRALANAMTIGDGSILSGVTHDPLQAHAASSVTPTTDLIQAITQTLATATPEQLQSLQQITSDLNLLQAVTTLISSQEGGAESGIGEGEVEGDEKPKRDEDPERRESTGCEISSPTDVLVSFPTSSDLGSSHTEEVSTTMHANSS